MNSTLDGSHINPFSSRVLFAFSIRFFYHTSVHFSFRLLPFYLDILKFTMNISLFEQISLSLFSLIDREQQKKNRSNLRFINRLRLLSKNNNNSNRTVALTLYSFNTMNAQHFFRLYFYWIVEWMNSIKLRAKGKNMNKKEKTKTCSGIEEPRCEWKKKRCMLSSYSCRAIVRCCGGWFFCWKRKRVVKTNEQHKWRK